jgi:hypothetical protein
MINIPPFVYYYAFVVHITVGCRVFGWTFYVERSPLKFSIKDYL